MSNKRKVLIILIIFSVLLLLYLVLTSKVVSVKPGEEDVLENQKASSEQVVDMEELAANHALELEKIITDYETVFEKIGSLETASSSDDVSTSTEESVSLQQEIVDKISELKDRVMNLKAPSVEYKDLHFNLVLAAEKIKDYLTNEDPGDKDAGEDLFEQAENSYEELKYNK